MTPDIVPDIEPDIGYVKSNIVSLYPNIVSHATIGINFGFKVTQYLVVPDIGPYYWVFRRQTLILILDSYKLKTKRMSAVQLTPRPVADHPTLCPLLRSVRRTSAGDVHLHQWSWLIKGEISSSQDERQHLPFYVFTVLYRKLE